MTTTNDFQKLCRSHHWKCTPQRLAVYTFVADNLTHPSVDQVWEYTKKQLPSITRESVYRILNEFSAAGLLYRLDRVECAHYDSQLVPHGHLICERCGKISDYPLKHLPELPENIPAGSVHHVEVRLSWLCPECRKQKE